MNALKDVRNTIVARMQLQSEAVRAATTRALGVIYHLHNTGCTCQGLEIRGEHVVVHIDPPDPDRLRGSVHVRRVRNDRRETLYVTKVMGCQVQWVIEDQPALLAKGA